MSGPVAYRGSVKDVFGPFQARFGQNETLCVAVFKYSDSFSVFDWGRMPDLLSGKGAALAVLAADLFERLQNPNLWREFSRSAYAQGLRLALSQWNSQWNSPTNEFERERAANQPFSVASHFNEIGERLQNLGLKTHYLGFYAGESFLESLGEEHTASTIETCSLAGLQEPSRHLVVRRVEVIRPQFKKILGRGIPDYTAFRQAGGARLVPLEVVFRFSLPEGSSLLMRAKTEPSYWASLALPQSVLQAGAEPGMQFEFPLLETFTKCEPTDRALRYSEALAITGLNAERFQEILLKTAWVAGFLRHLCQKVGLDLADGKLEWGISETGEIFLVDAIGPDELRLLKGGLHYSKEFLRTFYRTTPWYSTLQKAKDEAHSRGISDWKRLVREEPPKLPMADRELASQLYLALTNALTGKTWFTEAWSLDRVGEELSKRKAP